MDYLIIFTFHSLVGCTFHLMIFLIFYFIRNLSPEAQWAQMAKNRKFHFGEEEEEKKMSSTHLTNTSTSLNTPHNGGSWGKWRFVWSSVHRSICPDHFFIVSSRS